MKQTRQMKIKEIITTQRISSQEDLLEKLSAEGFETTQATLSRDLHELGIVRVPDDVGFRYIFHTEENPQSMLELIGAEIINVAHNETTVVIKTLPGRASGVASFFDRLNDKHILGTVAGDDCIILIPDAQSSVPDLVENIRSLNFR